MSSLLHVMFLSNYSFEFSCSIYNVNYIHYLFLKKSFVCATHIIDVSEKQKNKIMPMPIGSSSHISCNHVKNLNLNDAELSFENP